MKINTRTVWQMTDDGMHLIEQDSFDYDGPISKCEGESSSSTSSTTQNFQQIENRNLNLSDFDGFAVASEGGDVQLSITDAESVRRATELGMDALDANVSAVGEAFDFGADALDFGETAIDRSLDTVERVLKSGLSTTEKAQKGAFQFGESAQRGAFKFGERALDTSENVFVKALRFLTDTSKDVNATLSGAITQAAEATRSDTSVVLNNLVKFGALAIGVTVVALAIMKRG